ncbi:MAG: nuclear transport factor 2 family protein [Pseudomonadota bacterium]
MKPIAAAVALCLLATPAAAAETAGLSFDAVLAPHLDAIKTRDLKAIERTLTGGDTLDLFLPNGTHLTTRKQFMDLHVDWFADKAWSWSYHPVSRTVTDDLAVVTIRTRSEEKDAAGAVSAWSENWLTLTFQREPSGWALIHDQNTRIGKGP